jgi:hypothetical protein
MSGMAPLAAISPLASLTGDSLLRSKPPRKLRNQEML